MFDGYYYHGTHSREWSEIEHNPERRLFELATNKNYSRWLAAAGIYFFYENILQAIRFSEEKADRAKRQFNDPDIKPVVLKTKLQNDCKALVLFTPDGLHELWNGHRDYHIKSTENLELITSDSVGYVENLIEQISNLTGVPTMEDLSANLGNKANGRGKKIIGEQNIESRVITNLCTTKKYDIVIGAVQENTTFNEDIHRTYPKTSRIYGTNKFRGFGYHDHIEVCVLNPKIIIQLEKCESIDDHSYEKQFYKKATI